jgi:divalent metal cation (Fe/Co/Zn/Cd) transporter
MDRATRELTLAAAMKVARERHSSVLASNAIHHRVDSLTGIVTLVAIVGANVIENAAWLDPVGGLLISIMVIHAGAGNMVDSFCELVDQSIDEDVKQAVSKQARKAIAQIDAGHQVELRDVSGVKSGQNYLMDLEMSVPGTWSVEHVREMESAIRKRVGDKVRGVKRVRARFVSQDEPVNHKFDEFIPDKTTELDEPEPKQEEDSDSDTGGRNGGHNHDDKHRH